MKINKSVFLLSLFVTLISIFYSFENIEPEIIYIKAIEFTKSSRVFIVKGVNNKGGKFKIISIVEGAECDNHIKVGESYSLQLYSAFSSITKGHTMTGYGVDGIMIETEPENGYIHLYVSTNLNGDCYIK